MQMLLTPLEVISLVCNKDNGARLSGPEPSKAYHTPTECQEKDKPRYIWLVLSDIALKNTQNFKLTVLTGAPSLRRDYYFEAKFATTVSAQNMYAIRLRHLTHVGKEMAYQVAEVRSTKFPESKSNTQLRAILDVTFSSFRPDFKLQRLVNLKKKRTVGIMQSPKQGEKRTREESDMVMPSSESEVYRASPPRKALKNAPSVAVEIVTETPDEVMEFVVMSKQKVETPATKQYRHFYLQHLCSGYAEEIEKKVQKDLYFDTEMRGKKFKVTVTVEEL